MSDYYEENALYNELYQEQMNDALDANMRPISLLNLKTSDNDRILEIAEGLISAGENLSITFGYDEYLPFYDIELPKGGKQRLYLNKEIVKYILGWIKDGEQGFKVSAPLNVHENDSEKYMLSLLKHDRQNGATHFNKTTGEYKAIYPNGTINYGKLPYSPEELITKLNSL